MSQIMVEIPEEVLRDIGLSLEAAQGLARRMTALGLYATENVSLGYCS